MIAEEAVRKGFKPVLAGRTLAKLEPLAKSLGLESRAFGLEDVGNIALALKDIHIVIHCAGPFSATAENMMQGCLKSHTHYLDITGEIAVFERAQLLSPEAKKQGVVICPGVGFDVIPTDCVASVLKKALPDANYLALGFDSKSSFSPGTAKTSVEGLGDGGKIRQDGEIITVGLPHKVRKIDFGAGEKTATTVPWGDVSTAYHTTGIPNIEVYIPTSPRMIKLMKRLNLVRPLLRLKPVQNFLKRQVEKRVKGPSDAARNLHLTHVWGEATNPAGKKVTARLKTGNGYDVTVHGALAVLDYLQKTDPVGGTFTPSILIDSNLVCTLPRSSEIELS